MGYVARVVYPPHNADHKGSALHFQRAKLLQCYLFCNSSAPHFEFSRGTHPWPLPRGEYKKSPLGRGFKGWVNCYVFLSINLTLRNFILVAADFSLRPGQCSMLSPPTVPRRLKACGYHNVVAE